MLRKYALNIQYDRYLCDKMLRKILRKSYVSLS